MAREIEGHGRPPATEHRRVPGVGVESTAVEERGCAASSVPQTIAETVPPSDRSTFTRSTAAATPVRCRTRPLLRATARDRRASVGSVVVSLIVSSGVALEPIGSVCRASSPSKLTISVGLHTTSGATVRAVPSPPQLSHHFASLFDLTGRRRSWSAVAAGSVRRPPSGSPRSALASSSPTLVGAPPMPWPTRSAATPPAWRSTSSTDRRSMPSRHRSRPRTCS